MRQPEPGKEVIDYHEPQQDQEESAGLVVEEQAGEEDEGVSQEYLVSEHAKEGQDYGEERPEIELGEQQGVSLVECEQVTEEIKDYFF